jgi:tetratricopeptide (TPR) repeat protein
MARLEDILAIPGNAAVYRRLEAMLAEGSAIAFIGAGASFPVYPLWNQLIAQLAHEPVARGLADAADEQYWLRTAATKPLQVASQIHAKLGDPLYHTFLYETFKDRTGPGGLPCTPAQAALVRAGFKALITTNYDSGLLEARRRLRPEIRETGFTVWNQPFPIQRWSSGDLFQSGPACPVLFAHGHCADPASIVLDSTSYRRAYHDTPYRRLFENLWIQQHLVFVGFSFNDATLTQIADQVLWQTARPAGTEPRHVAIIGLPDDQPYTPEMRREYLDAYHAEALFYPVTGGDHSALQVLLESLATIPVPAPAPAPALAPTRAVPALFVHETTEDEKFTGRADSFARLDRWAADPAVKLVAITAIGGLGKTALAGRWLRTGRHHRDAVFFWSFYRNRDTREFFDALVKFGREQLRAEGTALELLASRGLVVVLDGLEVVQEVPGTVAYGKLLDVDLAEFLHAHCRGRGGSLVVLTSRFPFPDLTPYLGGALRPLPLPSLEPAEGAALLASLSIGGRSEDREEISRNLAGHPLALRLFARSMPPDLAGDPTRLCRKILDRPHLAPSDPLEAKMAHLLAFYEKRLPKDHRQALGLLALFRAPVAESALAPLWEKLLGKPAGDAGLRGALDALRREHLLTADAGPDGEPRYACHPILRDHFRAEVLRRRAFARDAASLLAGPPDAPKVRSLEGIQTVATAIELLLEAGELKAADDLYRARLGRLFLELPAPHWGMEVARYFVRDDARRRAVEKELGARRLSFYLNEVGLMADSAGEPETALEFYAESEASHRKEGDKRDLGVVLQNLGDMQVRIGLQADAARHFSEALEVSIAIDDQEHICWSRAWVAYVASVRGDVARADLEFSEANAIENRIHPDGADLYSLPGIQWAEHLLRTATQDRARELTLANRKICESESWQQDIAWCQWIFGWLDTLAGEWPEAHAHLDRAKSTLHAGHMIYEFARTLVTECLCWLGEGRHDAALAACERALELAAPRNYRLVHADALNLRARIALERPNPDPAAARDDAEAALGLAEFCEYAWGQRDALDLLARAHRALGNDSEASRCADRAADCTRRLTRTQAE